MNDLKFWWAMGLGVLLAVFALQNMATVEVQLLFWSFQTSRFFVIAVTFAIGVTIGWIIKSLQRAKRRREDAAKAEKSESATPVG